MRECRTEGREVSSGGYKETRGIDILTIYLWHTQIEGQVCDSIENNLLLVIFLKATPDICT